MYVHTLYVREEDQESDQKHARTNVVGVHSMCFARVDFIPLRSRMDQCRPRMVQEYPTAECLIWLSADSGDAVDSPPVESSTSLINATALGDTHPR